VGFAVSTCLVLLLIQLLPRQSRIDTPEIANTNPESSATVQIPEISMAKVDALTAKLDEPLQQELKNVISDTRQAIQFVASNFLPEN